MDREYGSPNAQDATAENFDSIVNDVAKEVMGYIMEGSQVLNRQPGSVVMSLPEQREEYLAKYKGNPQAKLELLQRLQSQTGSAVKGALEYIKWIKKMEKDNG